MLQIWTSVHTLFATNFRVCRACKVSKASRVCKVCRLAKMVRLLRLSWVMFPRFWNNSKVAISRTSSSKMEASGTRRKMMIRRTLWIFRFYPMDRDGMEMPRIRRRHSFWMKSPRLVSVCSRRHPSRYHANQMKSQISKNLRSKFASCRPGNWGRGGRAALSKYRRMKHHRLTWRFRPL